MKLIGKVTRDFHRCASYVRINIPQVDGVPLSIKAVPNGFSRNQFTKGTVVEVQGGVGGKECYTNGCRFQVVRVFADTDDVDESCRGDDFDDESSPRTLRFFLGVRYYRDSQMRETMRKLLIHSMGMKISEVNHLTAGYGAWITCREDQFARFLIIRDRVGIPNGFQDLRVEYVDTEYSKKVIDISKRD